MPRENQVYEDYWSITFAYTNIYGEKFHTSLKLILDFIDQNNITLDNYNDVLDKLDSDEEYVDAFDNIVYFDELGVENDTELEELTEEIYPGIRKMKK